MFATQLAHVGQPEFANVIVTVVALLKLLMYPPWLAPVSEPTEAVGAVPESLKVAGRAISVLEYPVRVFMFTV